MKKYGHILILLVAIVIVIAVMLWDEGTLGFLGTGERKPSDIKYVWVMNGMGQSPARINRRTGVMYLNAQVFPKLPFYWQEYIKFHEEGHYVKNTRNEYEVDEYASAKYFEKGYPLTESIKALTRILNPANPEHDRRVRMQFARCKAYDSKRS